MNAMFKNIYTTLLGLGGAAATYFIGVGGKMPANRSEWAVAASSIFLGALGVAAKDATTGSEPK